MGKIIKLWENPYANGNIFNKNEIELKTGLTVFVGCNGAGKTTLLHNIQEQIKKSDEYEQKEVAMVTFNNLKDGGNNSKEKFGFNSQFDLLSMALTSSEGEEIMINIGQLARKIGAKAKSLIEEKEFFILLDACDSGLSVDNVVKLKKELFNVILKDFSKNKKEVDLYILIAANEYELARNENCFDVINGEYVQFKDYEEYRDFILNSNKMKNKRNK